MFLVAVIGTRKKSELKSSIDIVSQLLAASSLLLSIHVETIELVILFYNALLKRTVNVFLERKMVKGIDCIQMNNRNLYLYKV